MFSRQGLRPQHRTPQQITAVSKGGYVLSDCESKPDAIIIASGSEVEIAMEAASLLTNNGTAVRVVSMPSTNIFDTQNDQYKQDVLIPGVPRVAVEAGVTDFWRKYVGLEGKVIGIDTFGESAPAGDLYRHFGITSDNVVKAVNSLI